MAEPDFLRTTRDSYDAVAADYADRFRGELSAKPLDRAMLAGFAELVRAAGAGPVADIGCGTGRVTSELSRLGLTVSGIDLSPGMIAAARRSRPDLRFGVGSMLALDLPDGALGGVVAWYSVIHIPPERRPEVFAEFSRVLGPGGLALIAFQVGDEPLHLAEALGHPVSLDFHRLQPDDIAGLLDEAGLITRARLVRDPLDDGDFAERTRQAFLLARKPAAANWPGARGITGGPGSLLPPGTQRGGAGE